MKKKIAKVLSFLLVGITLFGTYPLSSCSSFSYPDFGEMIIEKFDTYTEIGAAYMEMEEEESKGLFDFNFGANIVAHADDKDGNKKESKPKMIGKNRNGEYEVISFKDKDGKTTKQTWPVSAMRSFEDFTFIRFSNPKSYSPDEWMEDMGVYPARYGETIMGFSCWAEYAKYETSRYGKVNAYDPHVYYIIDNNTGKIYDTYDALSKIIKDNKSSFMIRDYHAFEDGAYIEIIRYKDKGGYDLDISGIYKMQLLGENLALSMFLPYKKIEDFGGDFCEFYNDKYGNLFSQEYMMDKNGALSRLPETGEVFKAVNERVYYVYDGVTQVFNENGEMEVSSFTPPTKEYFNKYDAYQGERAQTNILDTIYSYLIKELDNTAYFLKSRSSKFIHKYTFIDNEIFEYEKIALDVGNNDCTLSAISNDKLYYLSNEQIFYCDMETGKKTVFVDDYKFKTLEQKSDGKLYFTAVDKNTLDDVFGVINADDSVDISVVKFEVDFDVVYLSPPLNSKKDKKN